MRTFEKNLLINTTTDRRITMKLLKVIDKNLKSPFQNFKYKIGKEYVCTDFDESDKECSNGFYATDFNGLSYCYRKGQVVYEDEVGGKKKEFDEFKRRFDKITVLRKLTKKELIAGLKIANEQMGYDVLHSVFPVNPLRGNTKTVTEKEVELLKIWASVRASAIRSGSVRASVWDSVAGSVRNLAIDSVTGSLLAWALVIDSVRASVWDSVWASIKAAVIQSGSASDSVWASVIDSVIDSVRAYISSLFPNIKKWEHIEYEEGVNPFLSVITLWNRGFIPSFDGKIWRLHSGKTAKVVYEEKIGE